MDSKNNPDFNLDPEPMHIFLTTYEPKTSPGSIYVKKEKYFVQVKLSDTEALVVPLDAPTIYPLTIASQSQGKNIAIHSHNIQVEDAEGMIFNTANPNIPPYTGGFWEVTIMWNALSAMADPTRAPNTVLTGNWTGLNMVSQRITISAASVKSPQ